MLEMSDVGSELESVESGDLPCLLHDHDSVQPYVVGSDGKLGAPGCQPFLGVAPVGFGSTDQGAELPRIRRGRGTHARLSGGLDVHGAMCSWSHAFGSICGAKL